MTPTQTDRLKDSLRFRRFENRRLEEATNTTTPMPGIQCAVCNAPLDADDDSDEKMINVVPCEVCFDNNKGGD